MKDKDATVIRLIPEMDICWYRDSNNKRKFFVVVSWLRWAIGIGLKRHLKNERQNDLQNCG